MSAGSQSRDGTSGTRPHMHGGIMIRIAAFFGAIAVSSPAWALINNAFMFQQVPTLDEIGLGALIALVAGVAGWSVRRRSGRK